MSAVLTGLDGANPLGFLAAVGLLRWCTEEAGHDATLGWVHDGTYRPVIDGAPALPELCAAIAADAARWTALSPLSLTYEKNGAVARDLKPPPDLYVDWLRRLREAGDARGLAFAAGYASDGALDRSGQIKPTAIHFTAGHQQFLGAIGEIAEQVVAEDFTEALLGPWRYERRLKTVSWDASVSRDYALRASDPSREKRPGIPGADWLAFQALPLFPVIAVRGAALTTGCGGGWKSGWFRWPVWEPAVRLATVRSLVAHPSLERMTPSKRVALGVTAVLASDIRRADQGGAGSFGPARLATRHDRVGS